MGLSYGRTLTGLCTPRGFGTATCTSSLRGEANLPHGLDLSLPLEGWTMPALSRHSVDTTLALSRHFSICVWWLVSFSISYQDFIFFYPFVLLGREWMGGGGYSTSLDRHCTNTQRTLLCFCVICVLILYLMSTSNLNVQVCLFCNLFQDFNVLWRCANLNS